MIIKKIVACLGLIVLSCGACSLPAPAASTVIPPSPQVTENRIVLEETPTTILSRPLNPKPAPTASGSVEDTPQAGPQPSEVDFGGLPQALLGYLNGGGAIGDLEQELAQVGVIPKKNPFLAGDLDGNATNDLAVSIIDPSVQAIPPVGALLIYLLKEDGYELSLHQPYQGGPNLWMLKDLDADGRADLVFSQGTCGAHSCFEAVNVLSWDGISFVNRLDGSSADLPSPIIQSKDPDGDQVFQLEVTGTDYGSTGAGPTRTRTWIWTYNPDAWHWQMTDELLGESKYRIHMLLDADDSAKNGGYEQALLQYERVIADSSLQDWVDPPLEGANLGAYARFKMFLIYLFQGQADLAQIVYAELADSFPSGTPQYAFLEMADAFEQGFSKDGPAAGCMEVEKYASAHTDRVIAPLNSFGYANPNFTPQDLCL